jgi:hypothetical protein
MIGLAAPQTLHVEAGAGLLGSVALDKSRPCAGQRCDWGLRGYPVRACALAAMANPTRPQCKPEIHRVDQLVDPESGPTLRLL